MEKQKPRSAKVLGWFCLGLSIVLLAVFIFKSAAGREASPALLIIGMALVVIGLASAKKSSKQ